MIYRDDLIRAQKAAKKFTNEKIANKSGLHVNTVREVCKGKETVELPTLKKIADALEMQMTDLFATNQQKSA